VHEILSDLDLSGVNLVVLSACETARGERSGGDEITGLNPGLPPRRQSGRDLDPVERRRCRLGKH